MPGVKALKETSLSSSKGLAGTTTGGKKMHTTHMLRGDTIWKKCCRLSDCMLCDDMLRGVT